MRFASFLLLITLASCTTGINYPEGGYDYPKQVADKDTNFYYYPLKNTLSRKDSFDYATEYLFWKPFNEPNLSLRSLGKDVFRFQYSAWASKSHVIILTENKIVIKSGIPAELYETDKSVLTEIESDHLSLLERRFPLDAPQKNPFLKHYLDSMVKAYPKLLDPAYYGSLEKKTYTIKDIKFDYAQKEIPIKKEDFISFVNLFNNTGFWKLPFETQCENTGADGNGVFELEANTKYKYQVVHVDGCSRDTSKFTRACQTLIEFVHLGNEIHLAWTLPENPVQIVVKDVQLEEIKAPVNHKKVHRSCPK
jgi:hypothetical protein